MATKPFTVDGNIVVDEATLSNSTTSLVLPSGSTITGGGVVLDEINSDTDDLAEGTTNLYFTDARADARIALQVGANLDLSNKSTTDLSEGTNLYYTDARADARITAASITDLSDADQSVQTTDNVTFANITATGYIAGPATFTIDPAAVGDATGTVVILGDLQVDGTTTTINSTTLDVDDLNITVAKGAANAAAADGAGLTVDGANATFTYDSANDRWVMNKDLATNLVGNVTGTISDISNFTTTDIAEGTNLYYTDQRADARATLRITAASIGNLSDVDITGITQGQVLGYDSITSSFGPVTGYGNSDVDTHLNQSNPTAGYVLSWNGSDYAWIDNTGYTSFNTDFDTRLAAKSTTDLSEGTNEYYTSARVQAETLGGSLAGTISDARVQYGTTYSGTPAQGNFFFDSLNQKLKIYTGSAFVDAVPSSGGGGGGSATDASATFKKYTYTATSATNSVSGKDDIVVTAGDFVVGYQYEIISVGTTDFTAIGASANTVGVTFTATDVGTGTGTAGHVLNYDTSGIENVEVFVNGVKQVEGASYDYVATTGTSVTFTSNLAISDVVDVQVYELLTQDSFYTKTETYTQAEVNTQISTGLASYLPLAGGTMTGALNIDVADLFVKDTTGGAQGQVQIGAGTVQGFINIQKGDGTRTVQLFSDGDSYFNGGNVGIGVTDPDSALEVQSASSGNNSLHIANTSSTGYGAKFLGGGNTATRYIADFRNYSGVSKFKIDGDGNVGIGTATPSANVHIVSGTAQEPHILLQNNLSSGADVGITFADSVENYAYRIGTDDTGNKCVITYKSTGIDPEHGTDEDKLRIDAIGSEFLIPTTPNGTTINETANYSGKFTIGTDGTNTGNGGKIPLVFRVDSSSGDHISSVIEAGREAIGWDTYLAFYTNNQTAGTYGVDAVQEKMRITSAGHLLVGKTSTGLQMPGHEFIAGGQTRHTRDNATVMFLNREGSNSGGILEFYRDNSIVGNIGVADGDNLYISSDDTNDVGLKFNGDGNRITPCNASGADRGSAIDLGEASSGPFKDLYLSGGVKWNEGQVEINSTRLLMRSTGDASGLRFDGSGYTPFKNGSVADGTVDLGYSGGRYNNLYLAGGVYLGGLVGANKLDDYEEGEFTYSLPCASGGSFTVRTGYAKGFYTKIGRLVTIHLRYETQGNASPSGDIQLAGLPFNVDTTAPTGGNASYTYPILLRGASSSSYEWDYSFHIGLIPGTNTGKFYGQGDGSTHSYRALQPGDISSNFEGSISLTYKTNQ